MASDLLSRLPELEREAQDHERRARALRQIIEGVRALNGDAASLLGGEAGDSAARTNQYAPEEGPRGREAVRRIVSERPGLWRVAEIKQQVQFRGWPSSPSAIETAVKRLQLDGELEWVKKGLYRFTPRNGAAETAAPTNVDGNDGEVRQ